MTAARDARRDALFDLVVATPIGVTVNDIVSEYGWTHRQVNDAIFDLRHFLASTGDTITLPCDPQGPRERWLYRLVGSLNEVRGWTSNRVGDGETRIRTMEAVMTVIVTASDGRTLDGQKARVMQRGLHRLVEDLDALVSITES